MMPSRSILLCLSLFVSLAAFAAAPVVTFETDGVYAAVAPGHTVAWNSSGFTAAKAGLVTDTDNDGRVKLANSLYTAWIVFDVESAAWTSGGAPESPLKPQTIVRGPEGNFSIVYPPYPVSDHSGVPLWVRPGVGVWTLPSGYTAPSTVFYRKSGGILDATQMTPLGNSPATPSGFQRGDYLFLANPMFLYAGLVDARLDDPQTGGGFYKQLDEYTAAEGSTLDVKVVRIGGTTGTASVRCTVSGGEAGLDYPVTPPPALVFGPGEIVKTCKLQWLDDGAYNIAARDIQINLSDATGGAFVGSTWPSVVTLTDDDPKPIVSLGAMPSTVQEGDVPWELDVPIHVTNAFRGSFDTSLRRNNSTFAYPTVPSGQMLIHAKVPIPANNDRAEATYTFTLSLGATSVANASPETRSITVVDDDPPPIIIADVRRDENGSGFLSVRTQWTPNGTATVSWTTVDGTAKAGEDYVAANGTLTLGSGYGFEIAFIDDGAAEGTEYFYVDVTSVTGLVIPPTRTRYIVTIVDDDQLPAGIIVEPITVTEGDFTHSVPLHVKLTAPSESRITLRIGESANGTATPFKDFGAGGLVIFEPGETEKDASITIYGEEEGEPDEVGEITILDKTFTKVLAKTTVTILDDDMSTTPVVSLSAISPVEGNGSETVVPITVRLAYALPETVSMAIASKNGTATLEDYVPLAQGVKFLAGETQKEVGLAIKGDELVEGDETVIIEVMRSGKVIASMTLIIRDDDSTTAMSLVSIADVRVIEKTGVNPNAVFRVTIAPPAPTPATIKYATEAGTATAADFASTNGTLSILPGQDSAEIVVPVFGDSVTENDEQFSMRLSQANGVTLADDLAYATILDDDDPIVRPTLSVDDVVITEANEQTFVAFTLRLSQPTTVTTRIMVETAEGSAKAGADFEHRAVTLNFGAGQTTKTIEVPINGDTVHEETETFVLRLFNGTGMIVPDLEATCTILDDDVERTKRRAARH